MISVREEKMYVRISTDNIKFNDPHVQYKFEQLLKSNPENAATQIEEILNGTIVYISLE